MLNKNLLLGIIFIGIFASIITLLSLIIKNKRNEHYNKLTDTHTQYNEIRKLIQDKLKLAMVKKISKPIQGLDHLVLKIVTDKGIFTVRKAHRDINRLNTEAYCNKIAKSLKIPAPEVIYIDKKQNILIQTWINGEAGWTKNNQDPFHYNVYYDLGKQLRKLHTTKVRGFGKLSIMKFNTLKEKYDNKIKQIKNFGDSILGKNLSQTIQKIYMDGLHLLNHKYKPILLHNDIRSDNIIANNNKLAGIIDWSDAEGGIPEEEFAIIYAARISDAGFNSILSGYGHANINTKLFKYLTILLIASILIKYNSSLQTKQINLKKILQNKLKKLLDEKFTLNSH